MPSVKGPWDAWLPLNVFGLAWYTVSLVIGVLGVAVLYFEKSLPERLVNSYKFGKLLPRSRELNYTGETLTECIRDLFHGYLRQVPKRWFLDFYVFAIIYHSLVFKVIWLFCPSQNSCALVINFLDMLFGRRGGRTYGVNETVAVFIFGLAMFHFGRRCYESAFVTIFSDSTMSVLHYMSGFAFYASLGLALANLLVPTRRALPLDVSYDCMAIGFILFCLGSGLQHKCSVSLAAQRRRLGPDGTEEISMEHSIPTGGAFEYISCPHYLAELLIYAGLYVVSHFDSSLLPLVAFVGINQTVAALMVHEWYRKTFKGRYPRRRKAIIPFLL